MKKFDIYILKKFLSTFLIAISLILAIAVIFDFSEKIDNFIDNKAPTNLIIQDYYLNFLIYYGVAFSGLITFISVIFFTAKMSDNNEIIALYNAKISPYRLLIPYFVGALIIFTPNLLFQNYILPSMNESRLNFENQYIKNKDVLREKKLHKKLDDESYIFIRNYDVRNKKGFVVDIQKYNDNKIIEKISASIIEWSEDKKLWELRNYQKKSISNERLTSSTKEKVLVDLNIGPEELFQQNRSIKSMNFKSLAKFIKIEKKRGNDFLTFYQIEQNERFSNSFSIFIFTILGFLISNKKTRGGLGFKLTTGLAICFFYIFIMKFAITFTLNSGTPAYIAIWTPNILFLLSSMIVFKKLT